VLSRRDEPFPADAVRDLLGVVRSMYAAAVARGAGARELARIASVGLELADAWDMGVGYEPGTVGWRAAWRKAEHAARAVGDLVQICEEARPLVIAACGRVLGRPMR
jgi:hypothetical protein